jgi:hypothetical protein
MKQTFKTNKPPPHVFHPGQKVWLSSKDIHTSHPSCKLSPQQLGPYDIVKCTGNLTYQLLLPHPCSNTQSFMWIVSLQDMVMKSMDILHHPPNQSKLLMNLNTKLNASWIVVSIATNTSTLSNGKATMSDTIAGNQLLHSHPTLPQLGIWHSGCRGHRP